MKRSVIVVAATIALAMVSGCGSSNGEGDGSASPTASRSVPASPTEPAEPTPSASEPSEPQLAMKFTMPKTTLMLPEGWLIDEAMSKSGQSMWLTPPEGFRGTGSVTEYSSEATSLDEREGTSKRIAEEGDPGDVTVHPRFTVAGFPAFRVSNSRTLGVTEAVGFEAPGVVVVLSLNLRSSDAAEMPAVQELVAETVELFVKTAEVTTQ